MSKTYSNKQNAKRAAKQAGLDLNKVAYFQDTDGKWTFAELDADAEAEQAEQEELTTEAEQVEQAEQEAEQEAEAAAPVAAELAAAPLPPTKTFEVYGRSSVLSPVAMVHAYLDKLVAEGTEPKRKDALFALSQMGVNRFTARTQYQRWTAKRAAK